MTNIITAKIKVLLISSALTIALFLPNGRIFAGQEVVQQQNETSASLLLKINQCLNTNTISVVNFQNLKVQYDALLKKNQITEQELTESKKRLEEEQRAKQEISQQANNLSEQNNAKKRTGKYLLVILSAIILLGGLLLVLKSLTDYNIVSNNWNKARWLGAIFFIVSMALIMLILTLFYLIIRIAFF